MRRTNRRLVIAAAALVAAGTVAYAAKPVIPETPPLSAAQAANAKAWDFRLTAIDGEPLPLAKFRGKVVLLVNTASKCGFTPQYDGLQKLQTEMSPRGFTIVGVPSGDFAGQELGSNAEIAGFCKSTFGIRFPLAEKSDVVGPNALPVYRWAAARLGQENRPMWNFHKYLIGRDGRLLAAFPSRVTPDDPALRAAISNAIKTRA